MKFKEHDRVFITPTGRLSRLQGAQGTVLSINTEATTTGSGIDLLVGWDAGGVWWIDAEDCDPIL